jgi:hypothetical protein
MAEWHIEAANYENSFIKRDKAVICETYTYSGDDNFEPKNARILCQAENMANLLREFIKGCKSLSEFVPLREKAKNILSKIEGA